jgi:NAD(P)H-hydrate epimerase
VKLCLSDPSHLGEVPTFQRKIFGFTCGEEITATNLRHQHADLILDALIGYGLESAPHGTTQELIRWTKQTGTPILALDLPSGVNATSGETLGDAIRAHWTMTLALPKTGLLPPNSGQLFLADIGIPEGTYRRLGLSYTSPFGDRFLLPLTRR